MSCFGALQSGNIQRRKPKKAPLKQFKFATLTVLSFEVLDIFSGLRKEKKENHVSIIETIDYPGPRCHSEGQSL